MGVEPVEALTGRIFESALPDLASGKMCGSLRVLS